MKVLRILQSYGSNKNAIPHSPLPTPYSLFFLLFALLSCQTAPKTPDVSLDERLPLEPGGYVYLLADKDALPILTQIMFNNINNKQFQQMVDQTSVATVAVYVTHNEETGKPASRYRLAAWGNYPASRAKMALGSSREWKKQRSPGGADYWSSPQGGLSIALMGGMALIATAAANEEPPDPFSAAPGIAPPEGFAAFREGSILSCWLTDPGPAINLKIGEMGIPLEIPAEQLFISFTPEGQRYIARLQIQVASASQARGLAMMFALARNFIPPQADTNNPAALLMSVLFTNPPTQDENNLNVVTAPLTAQETALLLKLFSL